MVEDSDAPVPDTASQRIRQAAKSPHQKGFAAHTSVSLSFEDYLARVTAGTANDGPLELLERLDSKEAAD